MHVCTSVNRPVNREQCLCSLFFPGRPDRSTDRETCSLVGTSVDRFGRPASQWSKIRLLTVDRPVDRQQSDFLTDSQQLYFLTQFLLGFSPTTLLTLVSHFSSLINSGSVLQLKTQDLQAKIKVFKSLAFSKRFSIEPKFPTLFLKQPSTSL